MPILQRIIPLLIAALFLTILVFGFVILAYVMLILAVVSICFSLFQKLKNHFSHKPPPIKKNPSGRIIDSDEWHQL